MSGEGGAGTQDVSEHPGEPAASLPESFPLSPSAPVPHLHPSLPLSSRFPKSGLCDPSRILQGSPRPNQAASPSMARAQPHMLRAQGPVQSSGLGAGAGKPSSPHT